MLKLQKRETPIQNIAYMSLMAAINVVFVLLTALLPVLFFLIAFILPLTSTVVMLYCKKRYFPIYGLATVGLCIICTLWNFGDTLFYVIPSIITGGIFGLLIEKNISSIWMIFLTTLVQVGLSYAMIPLTELITKINPVITFLNAFGLNDFKYQAMLVPIFILALSLIQMTLTYMIINDEVKKLGFKINDTITSLSDYLLLGFEALAFLIMAILLIFKVDVVYLMLLGIGIIFGVTLILDLNIKGNKIEWILTGVSLVVSFFAFGILYQFIKEPYQLSLLGIYPLLASLLLVVTRLIKDHKKKDITTNC